jgi:FAD/FMN-containing dehydrogenase
MQPITDPQIIAGYLRDASNLLGHADALVRPKDTAEVAQVLRHCQDQGIPVTITAQRTSTTGAPVPRGGWLLSMERLTAIESIGVDRATAQGGVLLGDLQAQVEAQGRLYPPDPTSRMECSLGASIACNASGARSFLYGATRRWVESVEFVTATGEILHVDRTTPVPARWPVPEWREPDVKTAVGYAPADNLLDLIIGSEGTLGVITRATVRLTALPERVFSLLALFPDTASGVSFVESARDDGTPRLIEWYDRHALDVIRARVPELPDNAGAAVWIEQEATAETEDDLLMQWVERLGACGALEEHTLFASDPAGLERLRAIRHALPAGVNELVSRAGLPKVGTDFAVPDGALLEMMRAYDAVPMRHVTFGHAGDNHLHVNLLPSTESELAQAWQIWHDLYRLALGHGGTLSAEHGVGKLKSRYLEEMVGPQVMYDFRRLKSIVDPGWVLGRGTMLDAPVLDV